MNSRHSVQGSAAGSTRFAANKQQFPKRKRNGPGSQSMSFTSGAHPPNIRHSIETERSATRNSAGLATLESARQTAMNPNGPVAATGSLHGIQRKNRLLEIDKSNKQLAQRFEKVKPAVSYSEHMWSGLK